MSYLIGTKQQIDDYQNDVVKYMSLPSGSVWYPVENSDLEPAKYCIKKHPKVVSGELIEVESLSSDWKTNLEKIEE